MYHPKKNQQLNQRAELCWVPGREASVQCCGCCWTKRGAQRRRGSPSEPAERLSFFLWCTLHSRAPQIDEAPVVNQFIRVCITVSLDCFFLRYAKKNAVVENFTLKDYNDPLRSAYRRNRSTDDAVSYVLENIYSHLEKAGSSVVYHDTERQL